MVERLRQEHNRYRAYSAAFFSMPGWLQTAICGATALACCLAAYALPSVPPAYWQPDLGAALVRIGMAACAGALVQCACYRLWLWDRTRRLALDR